MKQLLAIRVQSFTDLITNSSSELFQLRTNSTVEEVAEKLAEITSGYFPPVYFDLEDYRKNTNVFKEERAKLEEKRREMGDDNKAWGWYWKELNHLENKFPQYCMYETVNGWFFDKEDPEHVESAYRGYLCNHRLWGRDNEPDDLQKRFKQFVKDNNYFEEGWEDVSYYGGKELNQWRIKDEAFKEFRKTHKELPIEFLREWSYYDCGTVEDLDGCILVESESDNSIPYDTWDLINSTFNGVNYHLG